jgi:6-pyruvoyl-tetrahydropterin synthase
VTVFGGAFVDFGFIRDIVGEFIDVNWDHACFVYEEDENLREFLVQEKLKRVICEEEPTAEFMAKFLYEAASHLLGTEGGLPIVVKEVTVWETANNSATYKGKE